MADKLEFWQLQMMRMNSFTDKLIDYKDLFEEWYRKEVENYASFSQEGTSESFKTLISQVKRVSLLKKAKRIRPILVFIGWELISGKSIFDIKDTQEFGDIINSAIALELFHTSALIYDDIIDEGYERRGEETIEAFYRNHFSASNTNHLATSAAILGGNITYSLADRTMNKVKSSVVRDLYYRMQYEIIDGQMDDCFGVGLSNLSHLTEAKILDMMKAKSGSYSITNPILTGMFLADPNITQNEIIKVIKSVGNNLGIIFQLTDDLLGIFGDKTGKSNVSDIIEGKKTLIMLNTYNKSNQEEKQKVVSILGNPKSTPEDINWLKNLIKSKEVDKSLKMFCYGLNEKIKMKLEDNFSNCPPIDFLLGMSQYLIHREV